LRGQTEGARLKFGRRNFIIDQRLVSTFSLTDAARYLGVVSILIYGAIMQPTPDKVSWELFVWAAAVSFPLLVALRFTKRLSMFGLLLSAWVLIGVLSALRAQVDLTQFIRDLVSASFWFLGPLLILLITSRPRSGVQVFTLEKTRLVLALTGAALSVRYLMDQGAGVAAAFQSNLRVNLEYLSSEPLVTYAFIYSGFAIFTSRKPTISFAFAVIFALSSLGLIAVTYRGPLILGVTMLITASLVFIFRRVLSAPLKALPLLVAMVVTAYSLRGPLTDVAAKIANKFEAAGTNSKIEEFLLIFSTDSGNWEALMGSGFGSIRFITGAGVDAAFTHNILSYAYLKTGYIGLAFVVLAFVSIVAAFATRVRLAWQYSPELITLTYIGLFQAAYKHFGYGLLIGVCLVASRAITAQRRTHQRDLGHPTLRPIEYSK
jgi:hypothetical protein